MSKLAITEEANFAGEWFLPTEDLESARKIPGTMRWTTRRARLELHDCFTAMQGDIYGDETNQYAVVHGISTDCKLLTMLEASNIGSSFSFGSGGMRQKETLRSSIAVVGGLVSGETTYSEMQVRIPRLANWLNRGGITLQWAHQTGENPNLALYKVEHMPAEVFRIPTNDAALGFGVNRSFGNVIGNSVNVTTYGTLGITPDSPQSLDWYFDQLAKVGTLLSFLCGTPMGADQIKVKVDEERGDLDVLVALRQDKMCTIDDARNFFLLRSALGADFGEVLAKWFGLYDSIAMPSQLAQSVLASDDLWMHVEFLSLMQALEGFHRATCQGFYVPAQEYEPIKQAILAAFPAELEKSHRASLKSRIGFGNEISLEKRLKQLAARLPEELRRPLFGLDGKVPRSWIDTRNYYTHWDETSKANVLDGADMHHAGVRLRLLLRVLYLDLVGIPVEAISGALRGSNREAQYLIQLNNAQIRKAHPGVRVQPLMSINMKDASAPDESTS